jgi:hypothetical protein
MLPSWMFLQFMYSQPSLISLLCWLNDRFMVLNNPQFLLWCYGFGYVEKVCMNHVTCNELCNLYFQHIFTKHLFTFLFNMSRKTQTWNWFNAAIILRGTMHYFVIFYNFYSIDVVLVLLFYQWSVNVFIVAFGLKNFLENNVHLYW